MPLPQATIRYVIDREPAQVSLTAEDSLALVRVVMRRCRALRGDGASILWTDFDTDGIPRRRYVDGRVGRLRFMR